MRDDKQITNINFFLCKKRLLRKIRDLIVFLIKNDDFKRQSENIRRCDAGSGYALAGRCARALWKTIFFVGLQTFQPMQIIRRALLDHGARGIVVNSVAVDGVEGKRCAVVGIAVAHG